MSSSSLANRSGSCYNKDGLTSRVWLNFSINYLRCDWASIWRITSTKCFICEVCWSMFNSILLFSIWVEIWVLIWSSSDLTKDEMIGPSWVSDCCYCSWRVNDEFRWWWVDFRGGVYIPNFGSWYVILYKTVMCFGVGSYDFIFISLI
jgi:hypothetical protein